MISLRSIRQFNISKIHKNTPRKSESKNKNNTLPWKLLDGEAAVCI